MLYKQLLTDLQWQSYLHAEFSKAYFVQLEQFLSTEKQQHKQIYPKESAIFNAYNTTSFHDVKVVIIGQDPYHGAGQAHGLCFSVQHGVAVPPSLKNIYKEIKSNYPTFSIPTHGNLQHWATQGVFLLNAILTVEADKPASHQKCGWEHFTNATIKALSDHRNGLIFLLWGNFAQQKASFIDEQKHHILCAAHPSPFSAHNGFFGCQHFLKVNEILGSQCQTAIEWQLPNSQATLF